MYIYWRAPEYANSYHNRTALFKARCDTLAHWKEGQRKPCKDSGRYVKHDWLYEKEKKGDIEAKLCLFELALDRELKTTRWALTRLLEKDYSSTIIKTRTKYLFWIEKYDTLSICLLKKDCLNSTELPAPPPSLQMWHKINEQEVAGVVLPVLMLNWTVYQQMCCEGDVRICPIWYDSFSSENDASFSETVDTMDS